MNLQISNFLIKNIIEKLHKQLVESIDKQNILSEFKNITIYAVNRTNGTNAYIIINKINDIKKINKLNNEFYPLAFYSDLDISNIIINESIEIVDNRTNNNFILNIKRHLNSFYQTDEPIRKKIHEIIYNNIININFTTKKNNLIIFLGGEMYIYGILFDKLFDKKIYITDTETINNDTIINELLLDIIKQKNSNNSYNLIDYKTNNILLNIVNDFIIDYNINILLSNISKTGLGKSLCDQINIIKPKYLILITCNYKITLRDIKMLNNYKLIKFIKVSTNYDIYISILIYK